MTELRKARGAVSNRDSRFESVQHVSVDDGWNSLEQTLPRLRTTVTADSSRTIIAHNQSPDVPFEQSINPYRGCEHGCVYCFARPTHAYLGLSPGLDFESRLFYKSDAQALLRRALCARGYRCRVLALGTDTDPYQPIERRYRIMRQILEVLNEAEHPVCITTKSSLVERDLDLLAVMADKNLISVSISVTTLDHEVARLLEPRATAPLRRLKIIERLAQAGIPVNCSVAPIIPVLTDPEIESILAAAAKAGAANATYILLRLPREVRDLFVEWLNVHFPHQAVHVMNVIRQSRQGRDNDAEFGRRRRGTGVFAEMIAKRFRLAVKRCGLDGPVPDLDTTRFVKPGRDSATQFKLF
ncbi:MAG: PA0069 family radical SAM protein [Gammaproteobacteria bacterium]|nr:PA0069 family radical SAM protein [Gammaproteobacteria bacterium]